MSKTKIALFLVLIPLIGSFLTTEASSRDNYTQCPLIGIAVIKERGTSVKYLGRRVETIQASLAENSNYPIQQYYWSTSSARILSGQGTPKIVIELPYWRKVSTVTLHIKGNIPAQCLDSSTVVVQYQ